MARKFRLRKKRFHKKTGKRLFYKKHYKMMTAPRIDYRLRTPFPPRYRTYMFCSSQGKIQAGTIGVGGINFFIDGNDLNQPFAFLPAGFIQLGSIAGSALNPAGLSNLLYTSGLNGIYKYFRVFASKVSWTLVPSAGVDASVLTIVPVYKNITPVYGNIQTASQAPYARGPIICTGNNNVKMNRLTNYCSTAQITGNNRQAIQSEDNYAGTRNTAPVDNWQWQIFMSMADPAASNSTNVFYECVVKYYVEFFALTGPGLYDSNP